MKHHVAPDTDIVICRHPLPAACGPRRRFGRLAASLIMVALSTPSWAAAESFENGDLFSGLSIKQDPADRRFAFGVAFQIAPVKALIKSQAKKQVDSYAAANPEAAALKEYIQYADTEQMRALADSGQLEAFKQALKDEITKNGGTLSPDQIKAIDAIDEGKLRMMADMIEIMQEPDDTLTFGIEPWVAVNFKYAQLRTSLAIAGYNSSVGTSLQVGNLGVELVTGDSFGPLGRRFGWTLGARAYAPTGTQDANAMALANILSAPKFLHEYATVSPFLVLGLDLTFVQWTVRGEYVHMLAVRKGEAALDDMSYVRAGTGLLVLLRWIGISVELDGLIDVKNAGAMGNTLMLSTGVRGYLGPVGIGAGIQTPLVRPDSKDARLEVGGVATGSLADINFLLQARLQF